MKIVLCQLSHESKNGQLQNIHMPLAIGILAEYLEKNISGIKTTLIKRPSELSKLLVSERYDIVMFSNYMWNEELNLFFSRVIKKLNKQTLVIFGGPNFSLEEANKNSFLMEHKGIDIYVEGDGEVPVVNIVNEYINSGMVIEALKLKRLPNTYACDWREGAAENLIGENEDVRVGVAFGALSDLPSPYLSGRMDKFFEDGAIPLLESNRGCPYSCSFCQQATKYFSDIRFYDPDRIYKELKYIYETTVRLGKKITVVEFADPNFGMYKQDSTVFDNIRAVQNECNGFPQEIWCSTGKSQPRRIIENANRLNAGSVMIRAAVQSMNPNTLTAVQRRNLPIEIFSEMKTSEVEAYSDVMLGLPNESYESYTKGFLTLIDQGIDEFSMPTTLLLKGTPMEQVGFRELYGIQGKYRVIPECSNEYAVSELKERVSEFELMVCRTNSMEFIDYINARKFNLIIMIYHNTRLLTPIYRTLESKGVARSEVFKRIFDLSLANTGIAKVLDRFERDLRLELFDTPDQGAITTENLSKLTRNKVFKYLTVALLDYRSDIINTISLFCDLFSSKLSPEVRAVIIDVVSSMLPESLNPSDAVKVIDLSDCESVLHYGVVHKTIEIGFSPYQNSRIQLMRERYADENEFREMMAYHLRPINIIKTVRYI